MSTFSRAVAATALTLAAASGVTTLASAAPMHTAHRSPIVHVQPLPEPMAMFTTPVIRDEFPRVRHGIAHRPVFIKLTRIESIASPVENSAALADFDDDLGIAVTAGSLVGTGIGAMVGCVGVGAAATPETIGALTIPACLVGAAAVAPIGAIIGTLIAGGPTLLIAGGNYLGTLLSAPGTSVYAVHH